MTYLLYFVGFLIAVSAFLYFVNAVDAGERKLKAMKSSAPKNEKPEALPVRDVQPLRMNAGDRTCPLCRSTLTDLEPLYASRNETNGDAKIMIHGCRYCYKPKMDEQS